MCDPGVAIAFAALQAGAQYIGEAQQSKATFKYQTEKQRLTVASAADAARHQYQGLLDRTEQVRAAAAQDVDNISNAYRQAQSRARVSAVTGGVMGGSVEEQGHSYAKKAIEARTSRLMNLDYEQSQISAALSGVAAQHRGRQEGASFAPVTQPDPFTIVARLGTDIANIWSVTQDDDFWNKFR